MIKISRHIEDVISLARVQEYLYAGMKFMMIIILILLMMTQVFSKWFIEFSFKLNQDLIARTLCENRDRPLMNCKGNCVLVKKMRQQQSEQSAPATAKIEAPSIVISSRSFFAIAVSPVFRSNTSYSIVSNSGKPVDRATTIFHPPA